MITLIILLVVFALGLLISKFFKKTSLSVAQAGRIAMGAMLVFTGISHFYLTKGLGWMMPDFLPAKMALVYVTGVLEIILGLGLWFKKTRKSSSLLLILFLIAILPANVVAAIKHVNIQAADFTGPGLSYLWFRIPLQLLFILWVYGFGYRGTLQLNWRFNKTELILS
ncbi:DoxX family protein [Adhaeribacter pallidiroseus]|uniref:DoxX family membrane protein n=1 Tax=Adhaeribacter pallidiroseus TaxID=2072847 RepID=A0A369QL25_9BACT|nr:hypothetical protein [Adhaeribacter pallidiroseus]RDC65424.1 hypothetical protein AHMF7616_04054 [Adhaeribacter pallidiroseus]